MQKVSKLIAYTLITFAICSCTNKLATSYLDIYGKYEKHNESEGSLYSVTIKPDNTYKYKFHASLRISESEGVWYRKGNEIFVTGNKDFGIVKAIEHTTQRDSLAFAVRDTSGESLGAAYIELGNGDIVSLGIDGNGVSTKTQGALKSFYVIYFDSKFHYSVRDTNANEFYIEIIPKDIRFPYFKNEKWEIDGNNLIIHNGKVTLRKVDKTIHTSKIK